MASPGSAPNQQVRFYRAKMPNKDDLVWVKVLQVSDTSATVNLLEYGNIEGMIPYTEFTRLRIRSVGKVIKAGRCEAACVLRMDADKGYIDLSKKQVTRDEAKKCEESYHKAKDVHSIVCHAADECRMPRGGAMEAIAWRLCVKSGAKHAFEWLKESVTNPAVLNVLDPEFQLAEAARKEAERDALIAAAGPALDKLLSPAQQAAARAKLDAELAAHAANSSAANQAQAQALKDEQVALIREGKRISEEFSVKINACHFTSTDENGREVASVDKKLKDQLAAQRDAAIARNEADAERKTIAKMTAEGSSGEDILHARIDAFKKERDALEKELEREKKCPQQGGAASERLISALLTEVEADLERAIVDLLQLSSKSLSERHLARVKRVDATQKQIVATQQVADALAAQGKPAADKQRAVEEMKTLLPLLEFDVRRSNAELLGAEAEAHREEAKVLREEQQRLQIDIRKLTEKVAQTAQHRLKAQPVKIHTTIEVTCTTEEGIICIRDVLRIGQAEGKVDPPIDVTVSIVAPPTYVLRSLTEQREEGIKKHFDAVRAMEQEMSRRGGTVKIVAAPRVIGEDDDGAAAPAGEGNSDEDAD